MQAYLAPARAVKALRIASSLVLTVWSGPQHLVENTQGNRPLQRRANGTLAHEARSNERNHLLRQVYIGNPGELESALDRLARLTLLNT